MNSILRIFSRGSLIISVLLLLTTKVGQAQFFRFELPENKNRVTIPFEMYNNLIVIPVRINDKLPLKFILDSGVRFAILSEPAIAQLLEIKFNRKITFYGAGHQRQVSAYIAGGPVIEIPGIGGGQKGLLVLEENYLDLKKNLGTEVHGIIGYYLFKDFVVEIDYNDNLITLFDPKSYKKGWWDKPIKLAFRENKPFIRPLLTFHNGDTLRPNLLIDTGASHALMLHERSHPKIQIPEKSLKVTLGIGLGGAIKGHLGRIKHLAFGGGHFRDVVTSFPDTVAAIESDSVLVSNGSLGGEVLKRYNVTFNYTDSVMYLNTNWFYKRTFDYNRSGINVVASGPRLKQFIVNEVIDGSPGDCAGVKVGDQILGINWVKKEELNLSTIHEFFHKREGKNIRLKIQRRDSVFQKKFELENLI